jgi:hypothetical protein
MKRDMDLIRELMLKLESYPKNPIDVIQLRPYVPEPLWVDSYVFSDPRLIYHLELIEEAGFIENMNSPGYFYRLSWAGHDFLDSVRSPEVWDRTKQAATAAGGFTVELLVFAAKTYLEGKIKGLIGG